MSEERLRRGIGRLYAGCGLLNWACLALLLLRLPLGLWKLLFFGQFLLLVAGGLLYLAAGFARSGLFHYRALMEFLIGVAVFVVLLSVAASYADKLFWLPGAFLIGYGYSRMRAA